MYGFWVAEYGMVSIRDECHGRRKDVCGED